jgi:hypothetical protein
MGCQERCSVLTWMEVRWNFADSLEVFDGRCWANGLDMMLMLILLC